MTRGILLKAKKYKKTATLLGDCFDVGTFLLSQAVASQVSSALMSLTSVFGMGTGGPSSSLPEALFPALEPDWGGGPATTQMKVGFLSLSKKSVF